MNRFVAVLSTLILALTLPIEEVNAQVIGDADGDGEVTMADVTFVISEIETGSAQVDPYSMSDVAHPCNGQIDHFDLALIERAARSGSRDARPRSICHGVAVGDPLPPQTGTQQFTSIDDLFLEIAAEVPEFAGLYFDGGGQATVALTDTEPTVVAAASAAVFARFSHEKLNTKRLEAVRVQFPFTEIHAWRQEAKDVLTVEGVTAIDTDEVANRFWIGLESWDSRDEVEAWLKQANVPLDVVRFEEIGAFRDFQAGFDQLERPLVSGLGGGNCTAGPIVDRNGVRGMVSNSHCTIAQGGPPDMTQFHQPMPDGDTTLVGTETIDTPLVTSATNSDCPTEETCRLADASFFTVGMTTTSRRGVIKNSYNPASYANRLIDSVDFTPLSGALVRKSGGVTGRTEGVITQTCAVVQSTTTGLFNLCTYVADLISDGGDSGSPVYSAVYPGGVYRTLFGVLWGGTDTTTSFSSLGGVVGALGNMDFLHVDDPPFVTITSPKQGASLGSGSLLAVSLAAQVSDLEDGAGCSGCQVTWSSDKDGPLGTVPVSAGLATLNTTLTQPGSHVLTALAQDSSGWKSTDQVTVTTEEGVPTVWVDEPADMTQIPVGVGVTFSGSSYDPEAFGPLGCGWLVWIPNQPGDLGGFGCSQVLTFNTLGQRTMTFQGWDPQGHSASADVTVNVVPLPATGPPILTWLEPAPNPLLARQQPHSLTAYATDPDGKSPIALEWVLKGSGLLGAVNGEVTVAAGSAANGASLTQQWLPANFVKPKCGGRVLDLELRAMDADGESASLTREITVTGPLC